MREMMINQSDRRTVSPMMFEVSFQTTQQVRVIRMEGDVVDIFHAQSGMLERRRYRFFGQRADRVLLANKPLFFLCEHERPVNQQGG